MPKMKTKSSAKKRFLVTGTGRVKSKQSYARHMMQNKTKKQKRQGRGNEVLCDEETKIIIDHLLPYAQRRRRIHRRNVIKAYVSKHKRGLAAAASKKEVA